MAFWNRKTKEKLQTLKPEAITITKTLKLSSLDFYFRDNGTVEATLYYRDREAAIASNAQRQSVELMAHSWPELIDKVAAYFEGKEV